MSKPSTLTTGPLPAEASGLCVSARRQVGAGRLNPVARPDPNPAQGVEGKVLGKRSNLKLGILLLVFLRIIRD